MIWGWPKGKAKQEQLPQSTEQQPKRAEPPPVPVHSPEAEQRAFEQWEKEHPHIDDVTIEAWRKHVKAETEMALHHDDMVRRIQAMEDFVLPNTKWDADEDK